jgi:two-component system NtrC family response regulator
MKLIFIDDEQTFLNYLAKRLILDGYDVTTTFSGEEGIDAASKEPFDVAVVDLKMPGIDGIEVQKRLKVLQPDLPCIVLSAHGTVEHALESGKYNAFKFLSKPVDMDTLIQTIEDAYKFRMEKSSSKAGAAESETQKKGVVSKLYGKLSRLYGVEK